MNYSERIKAARKHAKLTQSGLAAAVGIDQTSISNLERGKSRGSSHTASIASVCGVNPLWLETGLGEMTGEVAIIDRPVPQHAQLVGPFNIWDSESPLEASEVFLHFIEEKPGAPETTLPSGLTLPANVAVSTSTKLRFDTQILLRQGTSPDKAFCVEVKGNAMEPVMPSGSTVAFRTTLLDIEDGKMYALSHDGQLRVRLLYRIPGGGLRLRSYNQAEHPDEEYSPEQAVRTKLKVLGRVFWYSVIL
ncbi:LexA family transcriptional regulator [Pseudomonas mosselii]|uniref:LexA family transcriptional regulator n=1 Tax=Pseudomonas mosselii TaxID=78327 RepID=UPI000C12A7A6|nr:helix-turn-helix transcriptional regulator [Pseudomonas mosselii]